MSDKNEVSGLNTIFADALHQGHKGHMGNNIFPEGTEWVEVTFSNPAGNKDSTATVPLNAVVRSIEVYVSVAFDAGATLTVGTTGAPALVWNDDESILATGTHEKQVAAGVTWTLASVMRCTLGGAPTTGTCRVRMYYTKA